MCKANPNTLACAAMWIAIVAIIVAVAAIERSYGIEDRLRKIEKENK